MTKKERENPADQKRKRKRNPPDQKKSTSQNREKIHLTKKEKKSPDEVSGMQPPLLVQCFHCFLPGSGININTIIVIFHGQDFSIFLFQYGKFTPTLSVASTTIIRNALKKVLFEQKFKMSNHEIWHTKIKKSQ